MGGLRAACHVLPAVLTKSLVRCEVKPCERSSNLRHEATAGRYVEHRQADAFFKPRPCRLPGLRVKCNA